MAKETKDAKKAAKDMAAGYDKKGDTHLAILVDESYSMMGNQEAVTTGIFEFVESFRSKKRVRFWLGYFDDYAGEPAVRVHIDGAKMKDVVDIPVYKPRGSTPLNDAIHTTIKAMACRLKKDDRALVVILTDGMENASEMSTESVRKLIETHEKSDQWSFLFLGANIQSEAVAAGLGLGKKGQSFNFTSTRRGTANAMANVTATSSEFIASSSKADYEAGNAALYDQTGGVIEEGDDDDNAHHARIWTPQNS